MSKKVLYGAAMGAGAAVIAFLLGWSGLLDRWENTTWAWRVKTHARPSAASGSIGIILLDQSSLDWGSQQNGWSWPWPREVYGPIIDFCRRGGARVIAFDVLYTEPSVYGVYDDESLAGIMNSQRDFVGALFLKDAPGGETAWPADVPGPIWQFGGWDAWSTEPGRPGVIAPGATFPIPEVARSATVLANVADQPDPDGVFRRATLLRGFGGHAVPSLGLAAYLLTREPGPSADSLAARGGRLGPGVGGLDIRKGSLGLGDRRVPIDDVGRAILRYVGPTGTHATVSAAAVIQSELRLQAGEEPVLDPEIFRDRYVLFGFSAPGLLDLRPTPLSRVAPGVEIHATVLDDLLARGFLREAPKPAVLLVTLALAVLCGILVAASRKAWQSVVLFVLLLPLPAVGGLAAYGGGFWWPVMIGETAVALSLVGAVVLNYATEGSQRRFIKQAFKFYLSPDVIEKILEDPSQLQLGGERRELTILFSDLEGFTSISERLDPPALTALLNDHLSDMTEIVLREGGTLDKYEGDAFIAFWNAPLNQPDHATLACLAALKCQRRLAERREEFRQRTGVELRMRMGLHTGEVVVGNLGSRQRFNYTVLGDAANLASRLEGANKGFGTFLMVSEATRMLAGDRIEAREIGRLRVVGRQTPVGVFELLGFAGEPTPAWRDRYEEGLRLCRDGQTAAALAIFQAIPDDPVSAAYAQRCRELLTAADPRWDGVWTLTKK
jgi:adenylate cyclase